MTRPNLTRKDLIGRRTSEGKQATVGPENARYSGNQPHHTSMKELPSTMNEHDYGK